MLSSAHQMHAAAASKAGMIFNMLTPAVLGNLLFVAKSLAAGEQSLPPDGIREVRGLHACLPCR